MKILTISSVIFALAANSCTKPTNADTGSDAAKFVGTWTGVSSDTALASLTFTAGGNGNAITMLGSIGSTTGCIKTITKNLTASGYTILVPPQIFTDNCGVSYNISGSGSVNGNTLTFTETTISGGASYTYNFKGTK